RGAIPRASAPLPGIATYIRGDADTTRVVEAPTFERVTYENVYPGIDAVFYGTLRALEYDLVVAPGADPNRIALRFTGADMLALDARGDLLLRTRGHALSFRRPVAYQEIGGQRRSVAVGYTLRKGGKVALRMGRY